jgi:hypothetical protein
MSILFPMYYVLVDSHGTSLETHEDRESALRSHAELVEQDSAAKVDVAILLCDDNGVVQERVDVGATDALPA